MNATRRTDWLAVALWLGALAVAAVALVMVLTSQNPVPDAFQPL